MRMSCASFAAGLSRCPDNEGDSRDRVSSFILPRHHVTMLFSSVQKTSVTIPSNNTQVNGAPWKERLVEN